jgi:hypothetical protein
MYIIRLSAIFFKHDMKSSSLEKSNQILYWPKLVSDTNLKERLDNSKRTWKTKRRRTGALRKRDCRNRKEKKTSKKNRRTISRLHKSIP